MVAESPTRTVEVPGGTVKLYDWLDIPMWRLRAVEKVQYRSTALVGSVLDSDEIVGPDGKADREAIEEQVVSSLTGGTLHLDDEKVQLLQDLNDVVVWLYLESWTLDRPLPKSVEELLQLPGRIFNPIEAAAAKLWAFDRSDEGGGFEPTPANRADAESPTGDSEG